LVVLKRVAGLEGGARACWEETCLIAAASGSNAVGQRYLPDRCRERQGARTPLYEAADEDHAAVVELLLAAGADAAAAADSGSTPRSIAHGAAREIFVALEEKAHRLRKIAFAMGLQERLGAASVVQGLDPKLLRMAVEPEFLRTVVESDEMQAWRLLFGAEGEFNSDSDSAEFDEEGRGD